MKRFLAILLAMGFVLTAFTGCNSESNNKKTDKGNDRKLYCDIELGEYVELKDYKGIEIDTKSKEFIEQYNNVFETDVKNNKLYKEVKEGTVQNGDTINLDYEGKLDGVAFEGGTAKGYELVIGSKTFIDDFEEELIGVAVGETKDVTAKFPENYGKEELNGKEAIFTCTVNSIKKAMTEEEAYEKMKFQTAEEYKNDIRERAVKQYILNTIVSKANIKDYPQKDSETLCEEIYEFYVEIYKSEYNVNLETVLVSNGSSVEAYKAQISSQMVPQLMDTNMVMYYILDAEKLELLESKVNSQNVTQPTIAESYAVQDIVIEYLYNNAKIK